MDEKDYSEPYLEACPKNPCLEEENASSCTAMLTTQLAERDFERFSESEQAAWAEHVKTCQACAGVLIDHRKVREVFRVLSSPERRSGEPELMLSPQIICELQSAFCHLESRGDLVSSGVAAPLVSLPEGVQAVNWWVGKWEIPASKLVVAFVRLLGRLPCR